MNANNFDYREMCTIKYLNCKHLCNFKNLAYSENKITCYETCFNANKQCLVTHQEKITSKISKRNK